MRVSTKISIIILTIALSGCFESSESKQASKFLGYWKLDTGYSPKVIEIYQDGDAYFFNPNYWAGRSPESGSLSGGPQKVIPNDGDLVLGGGYREVRFSLLEGGTKLSTGSGVYDRLGVEGLETVKAEVKRCKVARAAIKSEVDAIVNSGDQPFSFELKKTVSKKHVSSVDTRYCKDLLM